VLIPTRFFAALSMMRPERAGYSRELLLVAFRLAQHVHRQFKNALAVQRPIELSPQIQPMIRTPGHGSLPAGHATESFAMAGVLIALFGAGLNQDDPTKNKAFNLFAEQTLQLAARISTNRVVAGLHYPVDLHVGAVLGLWVARYVTSVAAKHKDALSSGATITLAKGWADRDFAAQDALEEATVLFGPYGVDTVFTLGRSLRIDLNKPYAEKGALSALAAKAVAEWKEGA
jgi:membrane-associated phospholipid phosphatase